MVPPFNVAYPMRGNFSWAFVKLEETRNSKPTEKEVNFIFESQTIPYELATKPFYSKTLVTRSNSDAEGCGVPRMQGRTISCILRDVGGFTKVGRSHPIFGCWNARVEVILRKYSAFMRTFVAEPFCFRPERSHFYALEFQIYFQTGLATTSLSPVKLCSYRLLLV